MNAVAHLLAKPVDVVMLTDHHKLELPRFRGQFVAVTSSPELGDSLWTYSLLPIR